MSKPRCCACPWRCAFRRQRPAVARCARPWNALRGIAAARGWRWADRWALLRTAHAWQRSGFACEAQDTVADLCHALPQGLKDSFIDPLCVAALNTPANQASGQVFLRVLQDSLFGGRGSSDLLLPRQDLGQVFPQAAPEWLQPMAHWCAWGSACNRSALHPRAVAGWSMAYPLTPCCWPPPAPKRRAWSRNARTPPMPGPLRCATGPPVPRPCASRPSPPSICRPYPAQGAPLPLPMLALRSSPGHRRSSS
jgi:hypothetical protein